MMQIRDFHVSVYHHSSDTFSSKPPLFPNTSFFSV